MFWQTFELIDFVAPLEVLSSLVTIYYLRHRYMVVGLNYDTVVARLLTGCMSVMAFGLKRYIVLFECCSVVSLGLLLKFHFQYNAHTTRAPFFVRWYFLLPVAVVIGRVIAADNMESMFSLSTLVAFDSLEVLPMVADVLARRQRWWDFPWKTKPVSLQLVWVTMLGRLIQTHYWWANFPILGQVFKLMEAYSCGVCVGALARWYGPGDVELGYPSRWWNFGRKTKLK